jgi:outer membrane lipoprotein-sorting protein
MNINKKVTVTMVIAIASLFAASGITSSAIFAQSNGEDDETGTNNYEEFVNCLAQSEGNKGYASESEIRDCFRPIYDPEANTSTASSDNADDSNTNADDSNDIAPNTNTDSNN